MKQEQLAAHSAIRPGRRELVVSSLPLSDAELDRIPLVARESPGGLSSAGKANYRARRRLARGGSASFVGRPRLRQEMEAELGRCSLDTVDRSTSELVVKGYLEPTGAKRGRTPEHTLRRGNGEVYLLRRRPQPDAGKPQLAALGKPQLAAQSLKRKKTALRAESSSSSMGAAASLSPAETGSAAAEEERLRKTGWRFVHSTASGTYVRDPDGTDRPPPGYFAPRERQPGLEPVELPELEPPDVRRARAEELRAWFYSRFGGEERPRRDDVGVGRCADCGHEQRLERLGGLELCLSCAARRQSVALKLASQMTYAELVDRRGPGGEV